MSAQRVVVIGAGIGGLAAALRLAQAGLAVTVVSARLRPAARCARFLWMACASRRAHRLHHALGVRRASCGMRDAAGGAGDAGARRAAGPSCLEPRRAPRPLRRHRRVRRRDLDFCRSPGGGGLSPLLRPLGGGLPHAGRHVYPLRPDRAAGLAKRVGLSGIGDLWRIQPFATLWSSLNEYFKDPRLLQLFGRYATYCGASPFTAPATLMLVAHVEQAGVWTVKGGLSALAAALADLATERGVTFRYGCHVEEILASSGRVSRREARGRRANCGGDGRVQRRCRRPRLGAARPGRRTGRRPARPIRAVALGGDVLPAAETSGFPLAHHSVFFSRDYKAEFDAILRDRRLPPDPTVYVCAQDRDAEGTAPPGGSACCCSSTPGATARSAPCPPRRSPDARPT